MLQKTKFFLILAVLVFFSASACQLLGGAAEPTPNPAFKATPEESGSGAAPESSAPDAPAVASDDPLGFILAAMDATAARYPRTLRGQVLMPNETVATAINIQYGSEDTYRLEVLNPDGSIVEMILISSDVYVRMDDEWQSFSGEMGASFAKMFTDMDTQAKEAVALGENAQVQFEGTDTLNGVETVIYGYESTTAGITSRGRVWIGAQDNLVYQYIVDTTDNTHSEGNYDYTTPVEITPPAETDSSAQDEEGGGVMFGPGLGGDGMCAMLPAEMFTSILEREVVGEPSAFDDEYLGQGCSYDLGADSEAEYFMYFSVAPIDSYNDAKANGSNVIAQPLAGADAFSVNGADAEQLWVKLNDSRALVVAIGDEPNTQAALALALVLGPIMQMMP
jgi:hypothetical protein